MKHQARQVAESALGPLYGPARRIVERAKIRREFRVDRRRYISHAGWMEHAQPDVLTGAHREAQLTKDYHRVEKGMALREPKRPFGAEVLQRLRRHTPADGGGAGAFARDAVAALDSWNDGGEARSPVAVAPVDAPEFSTEAIKSFFESRRSVRDFDERVPTRETLTAATGLATNTPSVCNRQASRVVYLFGESAQRVLRHQNGNAGFRESIPCVAVVTVDTRLFAGAGERNQQWVDGGLFVMTLVWAMHAIGLSTCLLNWSMTNAETDVVRADVGIPEHEVIVTFAAVGYAREGHLVARSPRRPVDTVARFVG